MDKVPSVAMKGGTFPAVTMSPLRMPPSVPTASETSIAAMTAVTGSEILPMTITAETPDSASSEPTERSIPPAMMTRVMPSAAIPVHAI